MFLKTTFSGTQSNDVLNSMANSKKRFKLKPPHVGKKRPLMCSAVSYLVVVLAEGSAFSCKASPFCCISTERQERKTVGFDALPEAFPSNFNNPAISLLLGGELQFVRLSSSIASPSSTTVSSPVCTTPFLFSKDSFNCSFTLSTGKEKS